LKPVCAGSALFVAGVATSGTFALFAENESLEKFVKFENCAAVHEGEAFGAFPTFAVLSETIGAFDVGAFDVGALDAFCVSETCSAVLTPGAFDKLE
jgi:hypothetical protein